MKVNTQSSLYADQQIKSKPSVSSSIDRRSSFKLEKPSSLIDVLSFRTSASKSSKELQFEPRNDIGCIIDNTEPRLSFIAEIPTLDDFNEKIYDFMKKRRESKEDNGMADLLSFWARDPQLQENKEHRGFLESTKLRRKSVPSSQMKAKVNCAMRRMSSYTEMVSFRTRKEEVDSVPKDIIHPEKNGVEFANLMNGLGNVHLFGGNLELAKKSYESALHSIEHVDSKSCQIQVALSFHGMGMIAFAQGYLKPSLTWLIEAKNTLTNCSDKKDLDLSDILENLGFLYFVVENKKIESRECFNQSLEIRQRDCKNNHDKSSSINNTGHSDPNIARLKYMINVVTGAKHLNIDFVKILSQNPKGIGLIYPTVPICVCHLGHLYKTKYDDEKSALECYITAKTMAEVAELQPCHPCVKYIQSCIDNSED